MRKQLSAGQRRELTAVAARGIACAGIRKHCDEASSDSIMFAIELDQQQERNLSASLTVRARRLRARAQGRGSYRWDGYEIAGAAALKSTAPCCSRAQR